jgi:hypothetical protein
MFYVYIMALIDVISFTLIKNKYIIVPMLLFMMQPILFMLEYKKAKSIILINFMWDLTSDLLVLVIGLLLLKETLLFRQYIGIVFAIAAFLLLRY